jgi:hypothetical protein
MNTVSYTVHSASNFEKKQINADDIGVPFNDPFRIWIGRGVRGVGDKSPCKQVHHLISIHPRQKCLNLTLCKELIANKPHMIAEGSGKVDLFYLSVIYLLLSFVKS